MGVPLSDRGGAVLRIGCNGSAVSENIGVPGNSVGIFLRYKLRACERDKLPYRW